LAGAAENAAAPVSPVYERQRMHGRSIMKLQQTPAEAYSGGDPYRRAYGQQRLVHFGITMIVMGASFFLYYLGFFGRVDGPLNPAQLGEHLAASGMSKVHLIILAAVLVLLALSWNWIFNLVCIRLGKRLTCSRIDDRGAVCGGPVRRQAAAQKKSSKRIQRYVCTHGHTQPNAHFHPVKKGTVSHVVWMISVIFTFIVFYASYC
jgi:hypothetical protein